MSKKALLIGVSYTGTDSELHGTKNDTIRLYHKLQEKFGYAASDINMLIEHEGFSKPTGSNIMNAIYDLLIQSLYYNVTEVYIHFSGHGSQVIDTSGDELDGKDEIILPCDYRTGGYVSDDLLSSYISYFPKSARVVFVFDCCHSGTMLDLSYKISPYTGEHELINQSCKCSGDSIIMLSGCRDSQTSLDTVKNGSWGGALTFALLEVIDQTNGDDVTWHELVKRVHKYMIDHQYPQRPCLTSARHIYESAKFAKSNGSFLDFNLEPQ